MPEDTTRITDNTRSTRSTRTTKSQGIDLRVSPPNYSGRGKVTRNPDGSYTIENPSNLGNKILSWDENRRTRDQIRQEQRNEAEYQEEQRLRRQEEERVRRRWEEEEQEQNRRDRRGGMARSPIPESASPRRGGGIARWPGPSSTGGRRGGGIWRSPFPGRDGKGGGGGINRIDREQIDRGSDDDGCNKTQRRRRGSMITVDRRNDCKEKQKPTEPPAPQPPEGIGKNGLDPSTYPEGRAGCRYRLCIVGQYNGARLVNRQEYIPNLGYTFESVIEDVNPPFYSIIGYTEPPSEATTNLLAYYNVIMSPPYGVITGGFLNGASFVVGGDFSTGGEPPGQTTSVTVPPGGTVDVQGDSYFEGYFAFYYTVIGTQLKSAIEGWVEVNQNSEFWRPYDRVEFYVWQQCTDPATGRPGPPGPYPFPTPSPAPSSSGGSGGPPIPNDPPRKRKKMDDCCKISLIYLQEILKLLGQPIGENGEILKGSFPLEIERILTPKDPMNPGLKGKKKFKDYFELLQYMLVQQVNLDVALDPQGYELPTGEVMNPEYERPSEISIRDNKEPEKDKLGRTKELIIGKQIYIPSALQEMRYLFNALRRLEYLFPFGELADAKISKELLIPSADKKETLKIFNMIHAYEIQMQYLNAIIGDPREEIYLKDVDPNKKGNQEFNFKHLSLSHMVKELFKFQLDTNGDIDMVRDAIIRDLRTNLATRITTIQTAEMVQAIFEDTGMLEEQKWLKVELEGDPYAGHWKAGEGFKPSEKLDSKKEEDLEALARATLQNYTAKVKISRRSPKEKTDMRDLFRGLADFMARLVAVPSASLDSLIENAKFKVQTDMALFRAQVTKAASATRSRTKKRKK